jgi:formylglycine-generating enzyme required for sulfatase activity
MKLPLIICAMLASSGGLAQEKMPDMALIPGGKFEMGDHQGNSPNHAPCPLHTVRVDAFYIGINDVTTKEYCDFLNSALTQHLIEVRKGGVYLVGSGDLLCDTSESSVSSQMGWDGKKFFVLNQRENHPMVCVRWEGAAAYCNWLSAQKGYPICYNTKTWSCDFNKSGIRLPTEAEWECAALGGHYDPYYYFPWGNDADWTKANVQGSSNPFRNGAYPWTTPVGFFNGKLQRKADFGWPSDQETYQTGNGANGYGLYDMKGNVWQWCTELYEQNYPSYSPIDNPLGPAQGSPFPDGKTYRCIRGGSWFSPTGVRICTRDPAFFRGGNGNDPDGGWHHIGFRVVRPVNAESRPVVKLTPVPHLTTMTGMEGRGGARDGNGGRRPSNDLVRSGDTPPIRDGEGGGGGARGFRLLPPQVQEPLNLTAKQQKQIADLETETKAKLNKILTPEQQQQLLQLRPKSRQSPAANFDSRSIRPDNQGQNRADAGTPPSNNRPGDQEPRGGGGDGRKTWGEEKAPAVSHTDKTVGVLLNTPKACPGYTLFPAKNGSKTYLIDNEGRLVHSWSSQYPPGESAYLRPNGNLVRPICLRNTGFTRQKVGEGGGVEEYDWNGKLLWRFIYSTDTYQQHHDIVPMPNGNVLMVVAEKKSREECLAAGFSAYILRDDEIYPDALVEVQPIYPDGGKIVWKWSVWDHLIQNFDKTKANYGDVLAHPERLYVAGSRSGTFWNHANGIAYNAKLDQVVISARGQSEIWFIDHSTTTQEAAGHHGGKHGKGGDFIYRWGNPAVYKRGTASDAPLNQQHNAEWIPDGYPGAGHVTIFNNGLNRGYSRVEEIVPPLDANGHYILEPGKAYGPAKPVWHYEAPNRTDFFSSEISGAHRLPNGNTLICAGTIGNLFEVTPTGEIVWKYVNPVGRHRILAQGDLAARGAERNDPENSLFKVHRYPPDYPAFKGRDLTPQGVIELPASSAKKGSQR